MFDYVVSEFDKITFYVGYGGEVTEAYGASNLTGFVISTDGEWGAFNTAAVTGGALDGIPTAVIGVQFGAIDLFKGKGLSVNLATGFAGISASFAQNPNGSPSYFSGLSISGSGKLGGSVGQTRTCVYSNVRSGC